MSKFDINSFVVIHITICNWFIVFHTSAVTMNVVDYLTEDILSHFLCSVNNLLELYKFLKSHKTETTTRDRNIKSEH
jgi:hypothetical protein